jgi:glutathione S-transferase
MSKLTLISHYLCPYVQRAVIALIEKGVAHERVYIDLAAKPPWFQAISPLGKVPVLRVDDDHIVFESSVICEYLDETTPHRLHPEDPLERAQHRAFIEFGSAILADLWAFQMADAAEAVERKATDLRGKFAWVEKSLGDGPYFAGARFSLVDAAFGPILRYFDVIDTIGDFGILAEAPKVRAYRAALAARPSVRDAVMPDYADRLRDYLKQRGSYLARAA